MFNLFNRKIIVDFKCCLMCNKEKKKKKKSIFFSNVIARYYVGEKKFYHFWKLEYMYSNPVKVVFLVTV